MIIDNLHTTQMGAERIKKITELKQMLLPVGARCRFRRKPPILKESEKIGM